ncbi:MAG TPA: hypothetical protein VJR23_03235 [Candidatus Acidoferrales bacterium]|nr:hypothetical protein [Candidatus Acidoferrales bacterium]
MIRVFLPAVLVFLALPMLKAQEKPAQPSPEVEVSLKVQIVLAEFDGKQEISSLPYTLYLLGTAHSRRDAKLRYGVKVPISAGNGFTYQDVGTNIDCGDVPLDDGSYRLDFTIDRSSVSMPGENGKEQDWKPGENVPSPQPLIRSFRDEFSLIMKNGQTVEGTSAVDPVTGHVQKVTVTLEVMK